MPRYAAVDIGSNSVRMLAADVQDGKTTILAQGRQVTRLGESVFRSGRISDEALRFLLMTLARMANAYAGLEIAAVRAVATSAVRDASNQQEFLAKTSEVLGTNVEIISGPEEARLIHLGVAVRWPRPAERTLIIDVGGGSAELIISAGDQLVDAVSKPLGAVRLSEVFLQSDPPGRDELQRLDSMIAEKLHPFHQTYADEKFDRAIGTSASAAAIICAVNQIPRTKREQADRLGAATEDIRKLYRVLASSDLGTRKKMTGIGPKRAEIIVAGAAVFLRTLEMFGHPSLFYCSAGVREGIVADLAARGVGREIARLSPEQLRVIEEMAKRYGVRVEHGRHVACLANRLFEILQPIHKMAPNAGKLLEGAAFLHDIGHFVSGTSHHKHSAYLVQNSDLPGFTFRERQMMAALCRFHRKALPQARKSYFDDLDSEGKRVVIGLTPLLRIADALDRSHEQKIQEVKVLAKEGQIGVQLKQGEDANLEIWSATEAAKSFREVYGKGLTFQQFRAQSA